MKPLPFPFPAAPSHRWSLRTRVTASFAAITLAITALLAVVTWHLAASYMLGQRESSAVRQAQANARLVQRTLTSAEDDLRPLLTGLAGTSGPTILLRRGGSWLGSGSTVRPDDLPDRLLVWAEAGRSGRQRVLVDSRPSLVVVIPLVSEGDASYIEVFTLQELERTFRFLSGTLLAGVALATLLAAVVGRWTSRRALQPLMQLTDVAREVAAGNLGARLNERKDPDLSTLAVTFNRTTESLERRVKRDARFASDVTHELRTPLTTMLNAMSVLRRRREELSTPGREALDLLDGDLTRFNRMVADLLEMSRVDQGVDALDVEELDVAEVVRYFAATCHPPPDIDNGLPPGTLVIADRRRLERILANLVDNARLHASGVRCVRLSDAGGSVHIAVEDAGPGVPEDLRERVFERFARATVNGPAVDDSGTGLGLALVAEHVRLHGGKVWVEDAAAGGACFVVSLPTKKGSL